MDVRAAEKALALADMERDRLRLSGQRRAALVIAAAVVLVIAAWASLPYGIVLLTRSSALGVVLTASGALLLVASVFVGVLGVRKWRHARANGSAPESEQGRPNPAYDEDRTPLVLPSPYMNHAGFGPR